MQERIMIVMNKEKNLKYIITGSGRSGTGYMAQLLTLNGIPCGHEEVFNLSSHAVPGNNELSADSSWLSVPYLKDYKDLQVYHVVRNPVKVIESWMNKNDQGIWGNLTIGESRVLASRTSPYWGFVKHHLPEVSGISTPLEATIFYLVEWSKRIKEEVGDKFYRIETDCTELMKDIGIDNPQIFEDTSFNKRRRSKANPYKLKASKVTGRYREMLVQHAHDYGYMITF